jgi:hypothetical protein
MHSIASRRGTIVSIEPSRTALANGTPRCKWEWMFSIETVASSTKIPIAKSQSTQRHQIDGLASDPQSEN